MISVIIPTFNRENTILASVQSVLNQSYKDLELIVVDDCSNDNTVKIINQISDQRLRIIRHKKNLGACEARNTGIRNAKGSIIAFQDSDDIWRKDKLDLQLKTLEEFNADICISQMERHGFKKKKNGIYPNLQTGIIEYRNLIGSFIVSTQTILAKRDVFYDTLFDPAVKRMQDYDWIIRAGLNHKVCAVGIPLVDVYLQQDSITTYNYSKLIESYNFFLEKYKSIDKQFPEIKILMNRCKAYALTMNGQNASKEYEFLFKITKDKKFLLKYIFSKLRILRRYYLIKDEWK